MTSEFKLENYVKWTGKTCAKLATIEDDNMHMILGMVTEIGELADAFKKHLAYGRELDWTNIKEELGDAMFYIGSFCRLNDLDLEDIILRNVDKLETRYKGKFTQQAANNRDLNKERDVLEKAK